MPAWFDANPDRYWWVACLVIGLVLVLLLRPLRAAGPEAKGTDWRWSGCILLLLAAGRWPTWLVTRQLNEDEGQLIAGALTLRHDPVFWRAVDGGTAGPVDFFALLPAGSLLGADNFAAARITALALIAAALILVHQSLAVVYGRQVARVATFGAAFVEAFTLNDDLLHYSTELAPVALLALGFWAGTRRLFASGGRAWSFAGGVALGLVPLAKLQAAPMALFLGVVWIAGEIRLREPARGGLGRDLAVLAGGALCPLLAAAAVLTFTAQWPHAITPYILHNVAYVNAGFDTAATLVVIWDNASGPGALLGAWLVGCGAWWLLTLPVLRAGNRPQRLIAWTAGGLLLAAFVCVLVPHRPFLHYCQFLVLPMTLAFGAATGLVAQVLAGKPAAWRCAGLSIALLCSTGAAMAGRAGAFHPYVGQLANYQAHPQGLVALELRKYARPGEALGLWGWMNSCYAEAGLRQAVRNANSAAEIIPGPFQEYFRRRYLADLQASAPPVFIDAVGPTSFAFRSPALRHDQSFPALAAYIREHYTLVAQPLGNRVYARKDRLPL